jgi:hypothetical protein
MSQIDRDFFYSGYRQAYGPIKEKVFKALESNLLRFDVSEVFTRKSEIAFAFGNMKKETNGTYLPKKEGYYLNVLSDQARVNILYAYYMINNRSAIKTIFPNGRTGINYLGRGDIQLTHIGNYRWVGDEMGIDLVSDPDKALEPDIAFRIMEVFLAKGLPKYFSEKNFNYDTSFYYSRRLINGLDAAREIERDNKKFFQFIKFTD